MRQKYRSKMIFTLVALSSLLPIVIAGMAYASGIAVYVNGRAIAFPLAGPQIKDGRVLLPLRTVGEAIGAVVDWEEASGRVSAVLRKNSVAMDLDADWALVNGERVKLEVPVIMARGRVLVPVRFFGESLGVTVDWDDSRNAVCITVAADISGYPPELPVVTINGTTSFQYKVDSALSLLQSKTPDHFREICLYLETISEGEHSGVDVYSRNFTIGRSTAARSDQLWLASIIVHDAHHSRMHAEGRVFAGAEAERECMGIQKEALRKLGAPDYYIDHLDQMLETNYWEIPYDSRNW